MGGVLWTPEAEDLAAAGTSGVMEGGQPKVTWHVTVSPSGKTKFGGDYFDVMHRVLTSKRAEPHYLYDPVTDRLGQYFALDRSARALANDGSRRTNGSGLCNIQIEVVAEADDFTRYWKPGPNFRALMRDIRSWGVPDEWPAGNPYGTHVRSWSTYVKAGHFGHLDVPGNDHVDPQVKDGSLLFAAADNPKEETFMDVKNPLSGEAWPAEKALWSIWTYSINAARDAAVARKLAEAQAKAGKPLTAAEIDDIAAATVAAFGKDYDANVVLSPKAGA